jgi:MoxR-like ATPase
VNAEPLRIANDDVELLDRLSSGKAALLDQVSHRIVGQHEVLEGVMTAILSGGHALLVGVPGLAKTLMVSTIAEALALKFKRIQFTPDLMPSDITGTEIIEEDLTSGSAPSISSTGPFSRASSWRTKSTAPRPRPRPPCSRPCRSTR